MTDENRGVDDAVQDPARRRISPNALVLLFAWIGLGVALAVTDRSGVLTFLFVVTGWVLAVVAHEFGHAWIAYRAGDHTVAAKGYLSLDPLKYTDIGTSVVIPLIALALGGIGFPGGAVYLREDLMRGRAWRSAASLAGPAGTLLVLLILAGTVAALPHARFHALSDALAFLALLQSTALILNLLPVPGLDGYGVIRPFLPRAVRRFTRPFEKYAFILLVVAVFFVPGVSGALFAAALDLTDALGLPRARIAEGLAAFRFWT